MASYLTDKQHRFLDAFAEYGDVKATIKNSDMSRAELRKALMDTDGEFYKKFNAMVLQMEADIEYGKLANLEHLVRIRDDAMEQGNYDTAMKAIDAINKMSGNFAPVRKELNTTQLNITARIGADGKLDMTKKKELGEAGYTDE